MPSDFSPDSLDSALTGRFGRPLLFLEETDSTNERALGLLGEGAAEGTLVVANHQTGGRGRRGRTWESPPGSGLLFSLVLKPMTHEVLELLTTAVGVAVAMAVRDVTSVEPKVKWPNDVVVDDRKLAGILVESRLSANRIEGSVAGVGLNVSWPTDEDDAENLNATCLGSLTDAEISRPHLLQSILAEFESTYALLHEEQGRKSVVERATELSSVIGRVVAIRFADYSTHEGKAVGLASDGGLQVETEGKTETISVGEIGRLRPL